MAQALGLDIHLETTIWLVCPLHNNVQYSNRIILLEDLFSNDMNKFSFETSSTGAEGLAFPHMNPSSLLI